MLESDVVPKQMRWTLRLVRPSRVVGVCLPVMVSLLPSLLVSSPYRQPGLSDARPRSGGRRENVLVALAQHVLLHLAHGVARQLVGDEDAARLLETRQPVGNARNQRRLVRRGAGSR